MSVEVARVCRWNVCTVLVTDRDRIKEFLARVAAVSVDCLAVLIYMHRPSLRETDILVIEIPRGDEGRN